jgi:HK97 family phage major capsid protein
MINLSWGDHDVSGAPQPINKETGTSVHMLDNVYAQRRSVIAGQVRDLINVRGPRNAFQKGMLDALLKEAADLENGIDREHERKKTEAFRSWIRVGDRAPNLNLLRENRDMGTSNSGAYPGSTTAFEVPLGFRDEVESAMKYGGPLQELATTIDTGNGRLYPMPSDNDTAVNGEFLAENQSVSLADVGVIGQEILGSYLVSSKMVRMSVSLLEDSGFDAPAYIAGVLGRRLGRAMENAFCNGAGGGTGPTGIMTAATQAAIAVGAGGNDGVSGPNSIGTFDLAALESSVDYAYRKDAVFMCHPSTMQAMRALRDKVGNMIFPDLHGGQTDAQNRLFNYPLYLNPWMDQIQAEASSPALTRNVLAFGSFKKLVIRQATPVLIRLRERFAEYRQVAFVCLWRVDSNLLDGGGGAVKFLSTVF